MQYQAGYAGGYPPQTPQNVEAADMTIGIPHTGTVSTAWAINFRTVQMPPRVKFITLSGQPVDQARNMIVENAVGSHIFFWDSDVIIPNDTIPRLLKRNLPIVSGLYWRRATPPVPGMYRYFSDLQSEFGMGGHRAVLNWEPNSLVQVDAVGAGCLLVDRRVFQTIPQSAVREWYIKHYGDTPVTRNVPDGWFYFGTIKANMMSEDFIMTNVAKEYGFPTVVDTSVLCHHVLSFKVGQDGFTAVDAG